MELNGEHTIAAVIPAYNAEKYIARALDSVLAQARLPDEIIVVDDGSADNTADIVRSFGPKVTLIQQANSGVSSARNTGIRAAKSNWIAFLDADDEWLPERLAAQLALLERNPRLAWTTSNYLECLCEENRTAAHIPVKELLNELNGAEYFSSFLDAARRRHWGHTDCMLIRKDVLLELGGFNPDLPIAEDLDMWFRIAYRYPCVGFIPRPLAIHHLRTSGSLMVSTFSGSLYTNFMERHFQLARTQGAFEDFLPAASSLMRLWIRGLLFDARKKEIRELLTRFPRAFSPVYRCWIKGLTILPALTASVLRALSKAIRTLKLRRQLTRPPR
ncbi:MAG: glycosyltransferase family 2 protein [Planctomycetaceae bacterium]|nr:glycosyltransferase family 2 protein [Planctomycetaceae bacterium]